MWSNYKLVLFDQELVLGNKVELFLGTYLDQIKEFHLNLFSKIKSLDLGFI